MDQAFSGLDARLTTPLPATAPSVRQRARPRVELLTDRAAFDALAPEWDALVARCGDDQLFYRHWFLAVWLDHFGAGAALRIATLRDDHDRLVAVLPLLWRRQALYGLPVRVLASVGNLHSCRFDLVAEDPPRAAAALLARLLDERDWDLLQLADVPQGGSAEALLACARSQRLACGRWPSIASPCLPAPPHWDALQQRLDRKHRAGLQRRRRRLADHGSLRVERSGALESLAQRLDEGLALEAAGWKGHEGTAVAQDPATRGFYAALARAAAERGALALWSLRVDRRLVAFQYAIEHRGRCLLMKQAYDEALRDCGPGQLLMEDVLRDGVRRGLSEFDLLGDDSPAKRAWTRTSRRHHWLFVFRGARGRAAHALKFALAPCARRLLSRLRG